MRSIINRTSSSSFSGQTLPSMYLHKQVCHGKQAHSNHAHRTHATDLGCMFPCQVKGSARGQRGSAKQAQLSLHGTDVDWQKLTGSHDKPGQQQLTSWYCHNRVCLTVACPTTKHRHLPCAARSSGTGAQLVEPACTKPADSCADTRSRLHERKEACIMERCAWLTDVLFFSADKRT